MKKLNLITIQNKANLPEAIEKLDINNSRTVIVLNKKKVVGVVSQGDIIKSLVYKGNLNISVEKIMNKSFKFLKSKDLNKAKKIFKDTGISLIPILNKNMEIKSYITIFDII